MLAALRSWLAPKPQARTTNPRLGCERLESRDVPSGLPPAVLIDGAPTVGEGYEYRLNLTAVDPENDPVTGWTIDWGDGNVQAVSGNPSSVTHTYSLGVARGVNVTAAAVVGGETFAAAVSGVGTSLGQFVNGDAEGLNYPRSVAFAGDLTGDGVSELYVGEFDSVDSSRLLAYDGVTGAFVRTIGSYGSGLTERPLDLAAGADGVLYVAALGGGVRRFDPVTGQLTSFTTASDTGLLYATAVTVGPDGSVFVNDSAGSDNYRVLRYSTAGAFLGVYAVGTATNAQDLAIGPDGLLYAVFNQQYWQGGQQRTQSKVVRLAGPGWEDVVPLGDRELGKQYANDLGYYPNARIAFARDGDLFVAAPARQRGAILRYDAATKAFLGKIPGTGLDTVGGMTFGPDGSLYLPTRDLYGGPPSTSYVARFAGPLAGTASTALPVTVLDAATNSYSSSPNSVIPSDLLTYSWAINVPQGGTVLDLNVGLTITHPKVQELHVYLISPSGTMVPLVRGLELPGANFTATVFDDDAATALTSGTAPFTGRFRPMRTLTDFDGENVQGTWTLAISDRVKANRGTLVSWSLEFTRGVGFEGEPPVAVNDAVTIKRGTGPATIAVLANDFDPEGQPLTVTAVTQPSTGMGTVVLNPDGTVTYTPPNSTFTGTVVFTYTIADPWGNTSTATVTITVKK